MSLCLGIEGLGSSSIYLRPSVTRNLGTSLCWVMVGRPFLTTSRGMSLGYCVGGRPLNLVRLPCIFFLFFLVYLFTWIVLFDLVCFSLFLFYNQRSSSVGEQVWRACSCSCWVREHYRRFWRSSGSPNLSSSLLGTRAFPLRPSCHSQWRKKWVILGWK